MAGSAYTYAYTTLGEIFAWIIGWDLILEYAMGCATVASAWTKYLNKLLEAVGSHPIPNSLSTDPFSGGILNLPSVLIMAAITIILVVGIRESARTNATLVAIKLAVVIFVIVAGIAYVNRANWTEIPVAERRFKQEQEVIPQAVKNYLTAHQDDSKERIAEVRSEVTAAYRIERKQQEVQQIAAARGNVDKAREELAILTASVKLKLPQTDADRKVVDDVLAAIHRDPEEKKAEVKSWGLLGVMGLDRWLVPIDDATRSPFMPYGLSGIMLGAAIVFFAFIGFDSISTHAEEAKRPQRDVPVGILTSLSLCTLLYIVVAAVVTGMVPYPNIDTDAPIATAFQQQQGAQPNLWLRFSQGLIAAGGLAGMTSVLLVLFLSQARVFMAMSRDGLLPRIFGKVHERFGTPYIATLVTGVVICLAAALTPIGKLEEMVNIGTLLAFVMVCAAVFILRYQRPAVHRPFRCPVIYLVAPLGILVNVTMMLFLPVDSWLRLVIWLAAGMVIYFLYSVRHSHLSQHLMQEIATPRKEITGTKFDPEVVE